MNEALLKHVYKSIRGDRTALRTLVERYRGVAYALAYRETHSFPHAQIVAMRAWAKLAERLPNLAEPERFLELLAEAVRLVAPVTPAKPGADPEESQHSILRTEKVQARRALRKALADCPRPETNAFFLRFVEGLSSEEIGELYGVEPPVAVEAQAAVCLDLAYRSGLAGVTGTPPTLEQLPTERREAMLLAVRHAETNLDDESARRLSELVQGDADIRREIEAARTVLSLSPATFAAHRLHTEFVREAMQSVPLIEPRVTSVPPAPPRPVGVEPRPDTSSAIALCGAGLVVGITMSVILVKLFAPLLTGWPPTPMLLGLVAFTLPLGLLSLGLARPPLAPPPQWPLSYYLIYGVLIGALIAFLAYEVFGDDAQRVAIWTCLTPVWSVLCLCLIGLRWGVSVRAMEDRFEARFRRLETAVQVGPDARTPLPTPAPQTLTPPSTT